MNIQTNILSTTLATDYNKIEEAQHSQKHKGEFTLETLRVN